MNLKHYVIFFVFTFFILLPFLFTTNVINGNDLNGNIVPLLHFKKSILEDSHFPQWNPYINQGIPSIADPLYGVYNPVISIPILLFDYQTAIKVMYFVAVFMSCIAMLQLVRFFKVSNGVTMIIAMTYAGTSYLAARIVAGHLEKVISLPFLPLFIYCLINVINKKTILWSGLTAVVMSLILFSGDIYNTLYCMYSLGLVSVYFLFKDFRVFTKLILSIPLFALFSSIKIIPMLELQDYISKIKEPFIGGLNPLSFFYNLFFPFDPVISKIFPSTSYSTGFGWWESLTFIGPLSILGLYFIFSSAYKKRSKEITALIVIVVLFLFLSSPGSKLNPLHYLISSVSVLQYFHVPSRILAIWGVIILVFLGLYFDKWKNKKAAIVLLSLNLIMVFTFSQYVILKNDFHRPHTNYSQILEWVKNNNRDSHFTVHATSQGAIPQDIAYLNNLLVLQSNYGLFLKGSLGEKYNFRKNPTYESYNDIKPGYLISDEPIENPNLKIIKIPESKALLYVDESARSFASIDGVPQKVLLSKDKITVRANSKSGNKLILLASKYPGWTAHVDGKKIEIGGNRFIEINTLPGNHLYEFKFSSNTFLYGLLISYFSFFAWLFFILYNSNIIRKEWFKKS